MAVKGSRVSVGATATLLSSAPADGIRAHRILVHDPAGGVAVDLGGPDVTSANGYELLADEIVEINLAPGEELYAITASGSQTVYVLETGV